LILFDDTALTNIALRALLRLMKPQSELISTLTDVQLLSDKASVKFYNEVDKEQEELKDMSKDGKIDEEETKAVKNIIKKWSRSCIVGDTGKPNEKNQAIFRNLNVVKLVMKLLKLQNEGHSYDNMFKSLYKFLKNFCLNNKKNQAIMFPYIKVLLQKHLKIDSGLIADLVMTIVDNNKELCAKIDSFFIARIMKELAEGNSSDKFLLLLDAVVEVENDFIKKNQDLVMLLLVKNKKTVINSFEDFKNDDQLTNLLKEKEKKERELEKYKLEKRKKKLEKNEGKEEEDDNPASDTNYMSADEETEDKESAKKKLEHLNITLH